MIENLGHNLVLTNNLTKQYRYMYFRLTTLRLTKSLKNKRNCVVQKIKKYK
jgi:hypothetical protein